MRRNGRHVGIVSGVGMIYSVVMKTTYTITEAQAALPALVHEADDCGAIAITRHGSTAAYVVSKRRLDGMLESLELLGNADVMRAIESDRKGRTAFKPLKVLDD